jgi:hypothetical protein
MTPFPRCMGCGCQAVQVFDPADETQSPVGDVPLKGNSKDKKKKPAAAKP